MIRPRKEYVGNFTPSRTLLPAAALLSGGEAATASALSQATTDARRVTTNRVRAESIPRDPTRDPRTNGNHIRESLGLDLVELLVVPNFPRRPPGRPAKRRSR